MIRLLICGDRNWTDYNLIKDVLERIVWTNEQRIEVVIQGAARGADTLARLAAMNLGVRCDSYPAQWAKYGRAAGPIRNREMLEDGKPTHVLAFHDSIKTSLG